MGILHLLSTLFLSSRRDRWQAPKKMSNKARKWQSTCKKWRNRVFLCLSDEEMVDDVSLWGKIRNRVGAAICYELNCTMEIKMQLKKYWAAGINAEDYMAPRKWGQMRILQLHLALREIGELRFFTCRISAWALAKETWELIRLDGTG